MTTHLLFWWLWFPRVDMIISVSHHVSCLSSRDRITQVPHTSGYSPAPSLPLKPEELAPPGQTELI